MYNIHVHVVQLRLTLRKSNNLIIILNFFLVNVHMPKDRVTQSHQGYGFVEFMGEEDADYAIKIMNMIKLYGKPVRVNKVKTHISLRWLSKL